MMRSPNSPQVCRKAEQPERGCGLPKTVETDDLDNLLIDNYLSFWKSRLNMARSLLNQVVMNSYNLLEERMKKLLITLLLTVGLALLVTPAYGVPWTYYSGAGWTDFDGNNNTSPVFYPNGIGYLPSPGLGGEGGEKYDIEGLNFAYDNTYLYVSVTASFGTGVQSNNYGFFD
jgi:hypothetical protein